MIRHSSSFFISLTFHIILLLVIFFSWKNISIFHKQENKEQVCVKLSCLVQKKVEKKIEKIVPPKKIKPIEKKILKPKLFKKVKIIKKKSIKPKEKILQEIVKEQLTQPVYTEKIQKENEKERQIRVQQEYIDNNIQNIVKLLSENLYYPRSARKRGITGEVIVKFRLSTEAIVTDTKIIKSQSDILSRAAVKTIKELSGKFPKPKEELILEVPITYELKTIP
jgi:protein TonB